MRSIEWESGKTEREREIEKDNMHRYLYDI